jgi:hypothetical protein
MEEMTMRLVIALSFLANFFMVGQGEITVEI